MQRDTQEMLERLPAIAELKGREVVDASGDRLGTVDGVYVERGSEGDLVRYLAVRTGWSGSRRYVIPFDDVELADRNREQLAVTRGRDDLESKPTFDENAELSNRDEEDIYAAYGKPGYWEAVRAKQTTPSATPEIAAADVAAAMTSRADGPHGGLESQYDPAERPAMQGDGADLDRNERARAGDSQRRGVRRYDW